MLNNALGRITVGVLGLVGSGAASAGPAMVQETRAVLTESAHVSDGSDRARDGKPRFAGPLGAAVVTHNGHQYAAWYSGKDRGRPVAEQTSEVMIGRRALPDGAWERARIDGYTLRSEDAHNRVSLAVSGGDGVIHLTFDHHNTKELRYAHSKAGVADHPDDFRWTSDLFELEPNLGLGDIPGVEVTYPQFAAFPGGNLILYYRRGGSTRGEMRLTRYDSVAHRWSPVRTISSDGGSYAGLDTTRGPYLVSGMQVAPDGRLFMAWVFREKEGVTPPAGERASAAYANHGLYYASSPDEGRTWLRADGSTIADTAGGETIDVDNVGPEIVNIPRELGPSNVSNGIALDPQTGETHVLMDQLQRADGVGGRKAMHYVIDPDGRSTGSASDFRASDMTLAFSGDRLLAFCGRTDPAVWVADRNDGFDAWTELPLVDAEGHPVEIESGGYGIWDLGRLGAGVASLSYQHPPAGGVPGAPSAVTVHDFRIELP